MRAVIVGAAGRMGLALAQLAPQAGVQVVGAIERAGHSAIGSDLGVLASLEPMGVAVSADLEAALSHAQVMIDFSAPSITAANLQSAARARVAALVGTTGLDAAIEPTIAEVAQLIPVLVTANTSLGVTVLVELVRAAARALPEEFSIEISDVHHRHKVDAPSGTALALARATARDAGAIRFAIERTGDVVGTHHVRFEGPGERLILGHEASERTVFARGALKAARWLAEQPVGRYQMADLIGIKSGI